MDNEKVDKIHKLMIKKDELLAIKYKLNNNNYHLGYYLGGGILSDTIAYSINEPLKPYLDAFEMILKSNINNSIKMIDKEISEL